MLGMEMNYGLQINIWENLKNDVVMYQSNRGFNIPLGHTSGIDAFSCPGRREFDHLS